MSADGTLEVFSVGHGPLILLRIDGTVELVDPHAIPLGITPAPPREAVTIRRLGPGDTRLMFSDGVTEPLDPEGGSWNTEGLLEGMARHRGLSLSERHHAIDQENLAVAAGEPPADDRTVVVATPVSTRGVIHRGSSPA